MTIFLRSNNWLSFDVTVGYVVESFEERVLVVLLVSWMLGALHVQSTVSPDKKAALAAFP
jgi:hypothetical protein